MAAAFLAVLVPEADRLIGNLRERWDPSARRGLGAHISVRYPFLLRRSMNGQDVQALTNAAAAVPAFDFELVRVSQFPSTVFLDPEPTAPFAALRLAVERAFGLRLQPDMYPDYVPHLSVARYVGREKMQVIEQTQSVLHSSRMAPRCTHLALVERDEGPWLVRMWVPLGR